VSQGALQATRTALAAVLCSTSLLATPPALALPPTLDSVIVETTDAAYPILKALEPGQFGGFTELIGKLLFEIKPEKTGKAVDLLVDVFNSVPPETVDTFNGVVKESFAGLKTDSCTLVPVPTKSVSDKFVGLATQTVDSSKLKAFSAKYGSTIGALSKTDSAVCLPSLTNLEKLAVAQADVGRAFDFNAVRRFNAYTFPMLKGEVKLTDETFSLLVSAKSQAEDATFKEKSDFQNALKKLESASKKEKEKVALARARIENAAKAAAAKQ